MNDQVIFALRWYFVVQLFGLAVLPLALRLFRHLPDRGYGVSKPLGLLLAGWLFWLLTTLGWLHNTAGSIVAALALVAVAGVALHLAGRPSDQAPNRPPWRAILVAEVVFAIAFAAWCVVRACMPRIETAGGEKWMEIAFLRAILRSETFPPHDPWLSGFAISYYYFGYIIVAMVTRLASVPPSIAFNLGIAMLFALTCTGAFSLVYNLIAAERREQALSRPRAILGGLLGPLLVAVMGNLEGLLEVLHARGVGSASFWGWVDVIKHPPASPPAVSPAEAGWVPQRFFWWWQASRVVRDYNPWGDVQEVIDEFPAFSFLLGDMHPHVLALPFVLLAVVLALALYRRTSLRADAWRPKLFGRTIPFPLEPWELLVYAICLGGLGFLNTWDFPIYLFVVVAAYFLALLRSTQSAARPTFYVLRLALFSFNLLVLGLFLYFPFWVTFQSQAGGILPNLFNGTRLHQFLIMFGPLVFIAAAFVVDQARRSGVQAREVVKWTLIVAGGILGALALVLGTIALLLQREVIHAEGPASYVATWLRGEPIPGIGTVPGVWILVRNRFLLDPEFLAPSGISPMTARIRSVIVSPVWTALGLFALLVAIVFTLNRSLGGRSRASSIEPRDFILLLFATGVLLVLSVEYVYLKDHFLVRMNTVFKFYFQAWVLWAIAGAYALSSFIRRCKPSTLAAFLVSGMAAYPVLKSTCDALAYIPPRELLMGLHLPWVVYVYVVLLILPGGLWIAAYVGTLVGLIRSGRVEVVVTVIAALLIVAGLLYPILAIPKRAGEQGGPATLDGAAHLAQTHADDYAAITWLNENVDGAPVILEFTGGSYSYAGRVSAHTGLPTVLGWAGHERQWRGEYEEQGQRGPDIETLYTSVDENEVLTLLDKYGISYVYVGPEERSRYPAAGLVKFSGLMETVYDTGTVTIYRR